MKCGSSLAVIDRKVAEVALGTADGAPDVRPREHVFTGSKAPWHEITDALPQFREWPPGMSSS